MYLESDLQKYENNSKLTLRPTKSNEAQRPAALLLEHEMATTKCLSRLPTFKSSTNTLCHQDTVLGVVRATHVEKYML